jgi:hypothetical protein
MASKASPGIRAAASADAERREPARVLDFETD